MTLALNEQTPTIIVSSGLDENFPASFRTSTTDLADRSRKWLSDSCVL